MAITKPSEFGLTLEVLRELMTSSSGTVISHQVGKALRHKVPLYGRTGMAELRKIVTGLMDELRDRLATEYLVADLSSPHRRQLFRNDFETRQPFSLHSSPTLLPMLRMTTSWFSISRKECGGHE